MNVRDDVHAKRHRSCSSQFWPLGGDNERISTVEMTVKKEEEETIRSAVKVHSFLVKSVRQVLVLKPIVLVIIEKYCFSRALLFE